MKLFVVVASVALLVLKVDAVYRKQTYSIFDKRDNCGLWNCYPPPKEGETCGQLVAARGECIKKLADGDWQTNGLCGCEEWAIGYARHYKNRGEKTELLGCGAKECASKHLKGCYDDLKKGWQALSSGDFSGPTKEDVKKIRECGKKLKGNKCVNPDDFEIPKILVDAFEQGCSMIHAAMSSPCMHHIDGHECDKEKVKDFAHCVYEDVDHKQGPCHPIVTKEGKDGFEKEVMKVAFAGEHCKQKDEAHDMLEKKCGAAPAEKKQVLRQLMDLLNKIQN